MREEEEVTLGLGVGRLLALAVPVRGAEGVGKREMLEEGVAVGVFEEVPLPLPLGEEELEAAVLAVAEGEPLDAELLEAVEEAESVEVARLLLLPVKAALAVA